MLSPGEVADLLGACTTRTTRGLRDRALIATLYATGVRVSEALRLLPKDLDLPARSVVVQRGKGDRRRVVGLLEDAVPPLEKWLARRRDLGIDDDRPVFCTVARGRAVPGATRPGNPLSREHVGRVLRRLARRAGIAKRVHPHGFRHSHAALLRSRGLDVYQVKTQLGHGYLNTTDQYLHLLGAHELPERLRQIGPVLATDHRDPPREPEPDAAGRHTADVHRLAALLAALPPEVLALLR